MTKWSNFLCLMHKKHKQTRKTLQGKVSLRCAKGQTDVLYWMLPLSENQTASV